MSQPLFAKNVFQIFVAHFFLAGLALWFSWVSNVIPENKVLEIEHEILNYASDGSQNGDERLLTWTHNLQFLWALGSHSSLASQVEWPGRALLFGKVPFRTCHFPSHECSESHECMHECRIEQHNFFRCLQWLNSFVQCSNNHTNHTGYHATARKLGNKTVWNQKRVNFPKLVKQITSSKSTM